MSKLRKVLALVSIAALAPLAMVACGKGTEGPSGGKCVISQAGG